MDIASGQGTYETCGGDDVTYRIPLVQPVQFGGVTYTDVYATTNSVVTLGQPDVEYSSFPSTPSISLQATDWVERGLNNNGVFVNTDEFFNITTIPNGFTVDLLARKYSEYVTNRELTRISSGNSYQTINQYRTDSVQALASLRDNPANYSDLSSERIAYMISHYEDAIAHIDYFIVNGTIQLNAPVRNTFTFHLNPDNSMSIITFTSSTDVQYRNGCVLSQGAQAISLEECGILQAATYADIQLLISQVVEEIISNTDPINEPVQKSVVSGTSFNKAATQAAKTTLVIQGQFIEEILNIDVNGMAISRGDWVQNSTSVSITVSENSSGIYKVQLYNQAVPLVPPQLFVISKK